MRDLRDVAKAGGHLSAAVKRRGCGKLRGFYVDKVEHGSPNEFANMTTEELYRFIAAGQTFGRWGTGGMCQ